MSILERYERIAVPLDYARVPRSVRENLAHAGLLRFLGLRQPEAYDAHTNFAYSTVATAPSPASSGTTLSVQSGDGALFPAAPFNCTVWPAGTQPLSSNAEIVRVTSKGAGDNWTITRTSESTSARSIVVGDQISATVTARMLTDVETSISGGQFDYAEITSNVTVTATTDATATAIIDGNAVTYDGSTAVKIEFYGGAQIAAGNEIVVVLYDGATDLGRLSFAGNPGASGQSDFWLPGARILTPTSGSHTYHIKAWKVTAGTAVTVYGGLGGAGVTLPAWFRISKA